MADQKLTELPAVSSPTSELILYVVDPADTTDSPEGSSKQIEAGELLALIPDGSNLTGLTVWVDSVNGDDGTGTRGDQLTPFLTPAAAKAAAQSGDLVHVRPGVYTVAASIAKDGVNWRLEPGATVAMSPGAGDTGLGLFEDGGAAVVSDLIGSADLTRNLGIRTAPVSAVVRATNASTDLTVRCRDVLATSNTTGGNLTNHHAIAYGSAGRLSLHARLLTMTGTGSAGSKNLAPVWWVNGSMVVHAETIQANRPNGYAVWSGVNATPTGDCYVRADDIAGQGAAIYGDGSNPTAALWVDALTVRGLVSPGNGFAVYNYGLNKLYVTAQKLFGSVNNSDLGTGVGGGLVYVTAQKVSAVQNALTALFIYADSPYGDLIYEVQHADPLAFTGAAAQVLAGAVEVRGLRYVAGSGSGGFELSGGTLTLKNCVIDTSANNATNPINMTGGTLILDNCTLIAEGTRNAIEVSGATTIIVRGVLIINRPLHASIKVNGGPVVRSNTGLIEAGPITVRQFNGTPGTDEVQITHDGTNGKIETKDGDQLLRLPLNKAVRIRQAPTSASNLIFVCEDEAGVQRCSFSLNDYEFRVGGPGNTIVIAGSSNTLTWPTGTDLRAHGFDPFTITNPTIRWPGASNDLGIGRAAAKVLALTNASTAGATLASVPLSPAQITADQNDYAPGVARFYRLSTDAARTVTGLSCGQVNGQECEIWNVGSFNLVLAHESASSSAANRFTSTTGANVTLTPNQMAFLRWFSADASSTGRWRLVKGS